MASACLEEEIDRNTGNPSGDALELAEGFEQLRNLAAFDGAIRHKGVTLPEPRPPGNWIKTFNREKCEVGFRS
jgi:hypothetical protein